MSEGLVCSIGCTEPWNAAGLGLDARALAELGVPSVSIVAGVTAQDRDGLHAAAPIAAQLVTAQFAAVREAPVRAYRIGALLDVATLDAVAANLRDAGAPVVYDPVIAATAGGTFADADLIAAIQARLLPFVDVVTPNLLEAAMLTGISATSLDGMEQAALALRDSGAGAALVTGGHRTTDATDVLADAMGTYRFEASRLGGTLRGTGCLLAVALAANLARGVPLRDAVHAARHFVRAKIACAQERGGMSVAY